MTFTYRFSIWNHGPVPIYPDVYTNPSDGGWEPVRPLTLQPRNMAGVEMRVTITSCLDAGATAKWNTIPVTFTVYGIERHVLAPMNVQRVRP